jgi:outer membrane protein
LKKSALAILFIALTITSNAFAENYRIAVVNANKVVESSPQYDAVRKSLDAEFQRRNEDLLGMQKQIKQLEDKLSRDGAIMSAAEVKRLEQDIRSHRRRLSSTRDEYREDFTLRRNEEVNKLLRKVSEVVKQVGEDEKIDVILSDGVVFASSRVDITERVLERLKTLHQSNTK